MAKNIQIRFQFPKNSELKNEMQNALKVMDKYSNFDFKLDTKSFNSSLKEMSKMLNNLKSQLKNFGALDGIINENKTKSSTDAIESQTKALKEQQAVIKDSQTLKTNKTEILNTDGTKNLVKELDKVKTKTGEIVQVTKNYDVTSGKLTSTVMNTTNEVEKQEQAQQKALDTLQKFQSQMQSKLNVAKDNSLVSPIVISNLQSQLDGLTVDNFKGRVDDLSKSITALSSNDQGIVRLQNAINSIQNRMTNSKNKYGSLIDSKDLENTTNKVNNLKYAMQDLMNGKSISNTSITKSINSANNSLKTMDTNAKSASSALKLTQKDAMSLGTVIQTTMGKFGIYASTAVAMRQLFNVIKDGVGYVRSLDESFFNISATMNITKSQFGDVTKQVQEMSKEMGISAEQAMKVVQTYANNSTNMQTVLDKTKPSVILSNITGMDTGEVTKSVQSAVNAFDMLSSSGGDATSAVERYGDSLVKISQNLQYDFGDGISEIISGIKESGNVAYSAGMSYESYASKIGAMVEATGRSGSELGQGVKMIIARTHQIKELGDELGIAEDEFGKAGEALDKFDIAVEDGSGNLRSIDDILSDVSSKWSTMTNAEQSYLAEMMAGNRQRSTFISLIETMSKSTDLYNQAMNSSGTMYEVQDKYIGSFNGKLGTLKSTFESLASNTLNSNFMKGGIDALTGMVTMIDKSVTSFGAMPTAITAIVGSMTLFNAKARENANILTSSITPINSIKNGLLGLGSNFSKLGNTYRTQIDLMNLFKDSTKTSGKVIDGFGFQLLGLKTKLVATQVGLVATKVAVMALNTAISMGLSLAITTIISSLSKLVDSMITTKSEWKEINAECSDNIDSNNELISSVEKLVSKEEELNKKLASGKLSTEEQQQARADLLEVQKQIAEILPESASGFDNEGNKISDNTGKVLENLEAKKKLSEYEAIKMMKGVNAYDSNNSAKQYEDELTKYNELMEAYKSGEQWNGLDVTEKMIEKSKKKIDSYKENIETSMKIIDTLRSSGWDDQRIADELFGTASPQENLDILNRVDETYKNITASIKENTKAKEDNSNVNTNTGIGNQSNEFDESTISAKALEKAYLSLGYTAKETADRIAEIATLSETDKSAEVIRDATRAYGEFITETQSVADLLKEVNEEQSMTPELISQIASKYPEIGARITDVASVQEFLNNKISEMTQKQANAYTLMVENDQSYYQSKILNDENIEQSFATLCSSFVDKQGNAYSLDLQNYSTLASLKNKLTQDLGEGVATFITNFVSGQSQGYSTDLSNTAQWASSKAKIMNDLNNQINKLQNNMEKAMSYIKSSSYTGMTAGDAEMEKLYMISKNQADAAKSKLEAIQTSFSTYNPGFSSYSPTFGTGGSSNPGGKKDSSGSSKKEVEDIEKLSDRYHDLQDAITDVNSELELNKILQEGATGKDKIALMEKEIQLYKKQQQAIKNLIAEQKKEAQELKNSLSNQGVSFKANGDIANYNSILDSKVNWANSLSGDSKESAIEQVKALKEQLEKYDELVNKTIPSQEQEWESLNNTIKDVYKTQAELIADMERNVSETIEYELKKRYDAKKESLNKEKELYNKEYEEANFEEEMNSERNKLAEIQAEIDKVKQDNSRAGQLRLKQLLADYDAQQKLINDKIKEQQNQAINDRFDEEEALLDKEFEDMTSAENLSKMVADAISTGMIKIGDETINVQNSMNNMLKETEVGFANVALQQSEWLSNLEQIKTLYGSINSIISSAGMTMPTYDNVSTSRSRSVGDISVTTGNITITGNADSSTLGSIQDMLDAQAKEIYKNIAKQLG